MVIKLSGKLSAPGPALANIVDQIGVLYQLGIKLVLVHGGGIQADALARRLGAEGPTVAGRRITDEAMLEVAKLAFAGSVNTDVLAAFRRASLPAVGLSGVDAGLVTVRKRPAGMVRDPATGQTQMVDYGLVGDIDSVHVQPLEHLLAAGYIPVLCSLAADAAGQVYNINADTLAARVAVEIRAAKYFCLTTVDGVLDDLGDRSTLHPYLDLSELQALIESGRISGGMLPKLAACTDALTGGVPRVHIVSGSLPDSLLAEVFTNEGCGTLIVRERSAVAVEREAVTT
jgi:acetylglutamate kinase